MVWVKVFHTDDALTVDFRNCFDKEPKTHCDNRKQWKQDPSLIKTGM